MDRWDIHDAWRWRTVVFDHIPPSPVGFGVDVQAAGGRAAEPAQAIDSSALMQAAAPAVRTALSPALLAATSDLAPSAKLLWKSAKQLLAAGHAQEGATCLFALVDLETARPCGETGAGRAWPGVRQIWLMLVRLCVRLDRRAMAGALCAHWLASFVPASLAGEFDQVLHRGALVRAELLDGWVAFVTDESREKRCPPPDVLACLTAELGAADTSGRSERLMLLLQMLHARLSDAVGLHDEARAAYARAGAAAEASGNAVQAARCFGWARDEAACLRLAVRMDDIGAMARLAATGQSARACAARCMLAGDCAGLEAVCDASRAQIDDDEALLDDLAAMRKRCYYGGQYG